MAFNSDASNLVAHDTNEYRDVFVRDRSTEMTERVSVASDGTEANGLSFTPSLSADGRLVAFVSGATNLDAVDHLEFADIFVHNRGSGSTALVTTGADGSPADRSSGLPSVSGDGRYVAFRSFASNLVGDDGNDTGDVFRARIAALRRAE